MRLSQIKISGFKSFVDPTRILFPNNLTGIVGPNGCGKSNVIDAVRWVMGESSAKHLRGESMEDVIFSGSSARKPVGQASVELVFDNTDGSVQGEFARYNEISIRRLVTRAGQSKYFLNNSRCRRRDIADIFLGTGLGPRSYAIIEQGMVSRIIEAKPEDLRVYLEEAAGISKYKERRRETETRIRHTRENLDRLNDLREEIEKQLAKLKRQSRIAERYKELKQQQRRIEAELLLMQQDHFNHSLEAQQKQVAQVETSLQQSLAAVRNTEKLIEGGHQQLIDANDRHNEIQGRFYAVGSDISSCEQQISHQKNLLQRNQDDLQQINQQAQQAENQLQQDTQQLQQVKQELESLQPQLQQTSSEHQQAEQQQQQAEQAMQDWQAEWDRFSQDYHQAHQQVQVENKAIEHIERQYLQSNQRLQRLQQEKSSLDTSVHQRQIESLDEQIAARQHEVQAASNRLDEKNTVINELRELIEQQNADLDQRRTEVQSLRGRLSSLEALQQNVLKSTNNEFNQWLQTQQLDHQQRLTEVIRVQPGYELAAEVVLSQWLAAWCVGNRSVNLQQLQSVANESCSFIQQIPLTSTEPPRAGWQTLASVVQAEVDLSALLNGIYVCEDETQLQSMRAQLSPGERLVTRQGLYAGANWLLWLGSEDEHRGLIEREQEIKQIRQQVNDITEQALALKSRVDADRGRLTEEEQQREDLQKQSRQLQSQLSELNAQLAQHKNRAEQVQNRFDRLTREIDEAGELNQQLQTDLQQTTQRRNQQLERVNEFEQQKQQRTEKQTGLVQQLQQSRTRLQQINDRQHQLQMRQQSLTASIQSTEQHLQRTHQQVALYQQNITRLQQAITEAEQPIAEQTEKLQQFLQLKSGVEQELAGSRSQVAELDNQQRQWEQQRNQEQQQVDSVRGDLEQQKMRLQEISIHRDSVVEQLQKTEFAEQTLRDELDDQANIEHWQNQGEQLDRKINQLGPINLAAIDEYNEQLERKEYLDAQNDDLQSALELLESAIRKIDRETRDRFKETFDQVNGRMQERFPKLFGGGQAHLELTEDNLLTTGVSIMARPPGKRVTNLQLLSGGEKALTAVALIFAIFELNPSPFCMLDEVDAPLDDANVGRFCAMVQEMSSQVQFIFITHNKVTMELAMTLNGVTMHEPGVSRLVSVDIDEAAALAAEVAG